MSRFQLPRHPLPPDLQAILSQLEAEIDPRRLERGLAGARAGAVEELWWGPSWLGGTVRGRVGVQVPQVWLQDGTLRHRCDCHDTAGICAHVPALLARALADLESSPGSRDRFLGVEQAPRALPPQAWWSFWHAQLPAEEPTPGSLSAPPEDILRHLEGAPRLAPDLDLAALVRELYPVLSGATPSERAEI